MPTPRSQGIRQAAAWLAIRVADRAGLVLLGLRRLPR
jgi:hypothetical protein